jgi:hypothetical protein
MEASFARTRKALDEEFVPLPVAATVAYFEITEAAKQVRTREDLAEVRRLVAIALASVAPIYGRNGNGGGAAVLSAREINDLLFKPRDTAQVQAKLEELCIRRGDLRTALEVLKEARLAFGGKK